MRGKAERVNMPRRFGRITPAYAGKRALTLCFCDKAQDHPRVCGEKCPPGKCFFMTVGSPPRVRGKVPAVPDGFCNRGITPAHAGKSSAPTCRYSKSGDHPRACGEKGLSMFWSLNHSGSPPRMRGKGYDVVGRLGGVRITPAYAGKSSIQHLTASLGEFEVQKGHPVPHLRQRLQVWPDHARHLRHGLILHASLSAGQGRRLCPGPCPDTAGSGTPRGPSPAKRPHTSPPAATPGGCRAWQSGATAPGSR